MRVLFTTQPWEGHLNPLVPLAEALVAAGHEVAFACAPRFRSAVEARGFRVFAMDTDFLIAEPWRDRWPEIRDLPYDQFMTFVWSRMFAGEAAEHALPDLLAIARDWSPEVIVREMCEFGGWLAAEMLGLPHATVEVTLYRCLQIDAGPIAGSLARILGRAGRPGVDVAARLFGYLHLSFVPPSFQDPTVALPATAHALRPLLLDPLPGEQPPSWLANLPERPTVYVTSGTNGAHPQFFEAALVGIRELDVNVIATVGRALDPAQLGPQPEHVHLEQYISQALLLPHCDAVVTHGGFSSVLGALASGLPLVVAPRAADQPLNARRVAALGTGIELRADHRTPEAIRSAVETILWNPSYRQRARAIQAEIQALPGAERGVVLLEQLVAAQRPLIRK